MELLINKFGYLVNAFENNLNLEKFLMITDKEKTKEFLNKNNFDTTYSVNVNQIKKSDFIVCKPLNESCGRGIFFKKPGEDIPKNILTNSNYFFEKFETGTNYRILLYNNKIIAIFERKIPVVVGNGYNTIKELAFMKKKNIKLDVIDENYVPPKNKIVKCNNICNYRTGGSVKKVKLSKVPQSSKDYFIRLSKILKLRIFSIDLICEDIYKEKELQETFVINELEYLNDWIMSYELDDNFAHLTKILFVKNILLIFIIIILLNIVFQLKRKN